MPEVGRCEFDVCVFELCMLFGYVWFARVSSCLRLSTCFSSDLEFGFAFIFVVVCND